MKVWLALCAALSACFAHIGSAAACPSCPVGRAARQQVCEDGFSLKLLAVVLPFVVMGAVSIWVERATDRARGSL